MNEQTYDRLWEFTKLHKEYRSTNPCEPQTVAILKLYQDGETPLALNTALDIEEACHCIKMALQYAP